MGNIKTKSDRTETKIGNPIASALTLFPTLFVAFIFKLGCPACWPAYAGLLSSLGIGIAIHKQFIAPLTILFLLLNLFFLAFRAKRRRGYTPFYIGMTGSCILFFGKFFYDTSAAFYIGIATIIFASIWNGWPKKGYFYLRKQGED